MLSVPEVDVIIPCFNHGTYLSDAIESVLAQTGPRFHIIVVDDGSTDDTRVVARRYADVLYLWQPNQGPAEARNLAIHSSSSHYLVFLDADDRLLPNALSNGLAAFTLRPQCAFVFGCFRRISTDGTSLSSGCRPRIVADHYMHFLRRNFITTHSAVFRREAMDAVGYFNPLAAPCEDYDLYLRLARKFPVYDHGEFVAERRIHPAQITRNLALMLERVLEILSWQWDYLENEQALREAYHAGRQHYQEWYGEQLLTETYLLAARGRFTEAAARLAALELHYPDGFASYHGGLRRSNTVIFPVWGGMPLYRTPENQKLSGSLVITGLKPEHAIEGQGFAVQEDGRSLLQVSCRNAGPRTTVILDDEPLESIIHDESSISAIIPREFALGAGEHGVYLLK